MRRRRRPSTGGQRPENPVEHRVESLRDVLGENTQHEIAVLLEKLVFASIATVGNRIREMLGAVDLNDHARIGAQ